MRLWHQKLLPYLPRQQLLGQHRECCALRGKGWGRKHSVVDYVFNHSPALLIAYHYLVIEEMERRGYNPDPNWYKINWRGNMLQIDENWADEHEVLEITNFCRDGSAIIYKEHNNEYLQECLKNLSEKGISIDFSKKVGA